MAKLGRKRGRNTIQHCVSFTRDVEARINHELHTQGCSRAYIVNKALRSLFNLPELKKTTNT
jgi:hypothetical protein